MQTSTKMVKMIPPFKTVIINVIIMNHMIFKLRQRNLRIPCHILYLNCKKSFQNRIYDLHSDIFAFDFIGISCTTYIDAQMI